MLKQLSLQLWSIKDYTGKDFFGTLEALAKMGYTGVEFAGYNGINAKDMNDKLKELGLTAISSHVGLDTLKNNLDAEIEYLLTVGAKYMICPQAPIDCVEQALAHVALFNQVGEKCAKAGLTFGYHNHAHEFKLDNGQVPLEVLFDNVNPLYVKQQPDVFWVEYAGLDAFDYVKKNVARCPIIHLKQLQNHETKENVDAGSGIIDFGALITLAKDADFVYEQEHFVGTSIENVQKSLDYILSL
ncbi:MAG: sugar phosphate isomerase/epimerase [Hyphomonadaceae bacterium]|nr:sugar phosphate isomerase/epimerase [Clostridia bacterium]